MPEPEDREDAGVDRRVFLGLVAGGAAGAALVAATAAAAWPSDRAASAGSTTSTTMPGMTGTTVAEGAMTNDQMDASMKDKIDQFLKNTKTPITEGVGATDLAFRMEGDVRVFDLVCKRAQWQVTPDKTVEAFTFNGIVPGPTIRVVEGQPVRINVKNELDQSTTVHWHGQNVPNKMDGVAFITQDPIKPGQSFVYEFTPGPFGSHMYHSHHNATEQVGQGMLGALLVEPADKSKEPKYDKEYLYILNDVLGGFTINGKGFPATAAYVANKGERVRFRFMNEGQMAHPIHLHGIPYEIFARDGYPLPQPFTCDTITVGPGERWDAIVTADNPGVWAFHCHILSHAETSTGMFGMVSVLIVQ
jgi:FtsP/CotA-like multicopper oxidase with cupredoxin domain